jgi:hypothetical protein
LQVARYVQPYREPGVKALEPELTPATLNPEEQALLKLELKLDKVFESFRAEVLRTLASSLTNQVS